MFPTLKGFLVRCSTGCSCCRNENHTCGPLETREAAEKVVDDFRKNRYLASQYAPNGVYDIEEADIERLPDGRLIVDGDLVVFGWSDQPLPRGQ